MYLFKFRFLGFKGCTILYNFYFYGGLIAIMELRDYFIWVLLKYNIHIKTLNKLCITTTNSK